MRKRANPAQPSSDAGLSELVFPAAGSLAGLPLEVTRLSSHTASELQATLSALARSGCASPLSAQELTRVDPSGKLRALGLSAVQVNFLGDHLAESGTNGAPLAAAANQAERLVVLDSRYVAVCSALSREARVAMIGLSLGERADDQGRARAAQELLSSDGRMPLELFGAEASLPGVHRTVPPATGPRMKLAGETAKGISARYRDAFPADPELVVRAQDGLSTPLRFSPRDGTLLVDRSMLSLSEEHLRALLSLAIEVRASSARISAPHRADRLARGMIDVVQKLAGDEGSLAELKGSLESLRDVGWNTTALDAVLDSAAAVAKSRSARREKKISAPPKQGLARGVLAAGRAAKRLAALEVFRVIKRESYPAIVKAVAPHAGTPAPEACGLLPHSQLSFLAASQPGTPVAAIRQAIAAAPEFGHLLSFGGSSAAEEFSRLVTVLTPEAIVARCGRGGAQALLCALDSPGALYSHDSREHLRLALAMQRLDWLRAVLGEEYRAVLELLPSGEHRLAFLEGLSVPSDLVGYIASMRESDGGRVPGVEQRILLGERLARKDLRPIFDAIGNPAEEMVLISLVREFFSGLTPLFGAGQPELTTAAEKARELAATRACFLAAAQLWGEQRDAVSMSCSLHGPAIKRELAAEASRIVKSPEVLARASLLMRHLRIEAPPAIEARLAEILAGLPVEVCNVHPESQGGAFRLERAALRYALGARSSQLHAVATAKLLSFIDSDPSGTRGLPRHLARLFRLNKGPEVTRGVLVCALRRGVSQMADFEFPVGDLGPALLALPRETREEIALDLLPDKGKLLSELSNLSSPSLKHALLLSLPEKALARSLNELAAEEQVAVLEGIDDPRLLRAVANDIESRLARNALLYRHAYDRCVEGLPGSLSTLMLPKPVPNLYAVLGLPRHASTDDIKKSAKLLQMLFHPDRNIGDAEAEGRFKSLVSALEVLSDRERRLAYDRVLPHRAGLYPTRRWMDLVPQV